MSNRAGLYEPVDLDNGRILPRIRVSRDLDGLSRLATLVHEIGHWLSDERGWDPLYAQAIQTACEDWLDMPLPVRIAVGHEEATAWQLGLGVAIQHGLDDVPQFVEIAHERFENYRERLDIGERFDEIKASIAQSR
jgi:hypothetical protein